LDNVNASQRKNLEKFVLEIRVVHLDEVLIQEVNR